MVTRGTLEYGLGLQVHSLDEEVLQAAVTIQKLQRRRANLKALQHKLQVSTAAPLPSLHHAPVQSHKALRSFPDALLLYRYAMWRHSHLLYVCYTFARQDQGPS